MAGMAIDRLAQPPPGRAPASTEDDQVSRAAGRLASAEATGVPCAPVRDLIGGDDVPRAYRVQELLIEGKTRAGHRRVGRKIGLTSRAVQAQLGVHQPDFGTLLDTMAVRPGEPIPAGRLLQPRIEAEIAFVIERDLDRPDLTPAEVRAAVGVALPALEIVDSRIAGWDITIADTVADNASSGLFVLGDARVPLSSWDPVTVKMTLWEDGREVSEGTGAACLGDPLRALAWLAGIAVEFGAPLRAGEIILSGSLAPMVAVRPGAAYRAVLSGMGEVCASFAAGDPGTERVPS